MKILWFTGRSSYKRSSYGGGGWIRSLAEEMTKVPGIELTMAYLYDKKEEPFQENGYTKYPIFKKKTIHNKVLYSLSAEYARRFDDDNETIIREAIRAINPDIIQVFGTENVCAPLVGYDLGIPVVMYLQGMLRPIYDSYYPSGMSDYTIMLNKKDVNEWILRNGLIRRHRDLRRIALRESKILNESKYLIGRTSFDFQVSSLFSPDSRYYQLNESMRAGFYQQKPWKKQRRNIYHIFSTLSGVTYKGFDVILRTAKLLKERNCMFEWHVAGITQDNPIVKTFERILKIKSNNVCVLYEGILSETDLIQKLLDSDVMVHPSYIDNSPNSVCESQLLGTPVIACYVGGVPDFIKHGVTGLLVPANDPYDLAYMIKKDIESPYMYEYSEPARVEALKRHDGKTIVENILSIYNDIINHERE